MALASNLQAGAVSIGTTATPIGLPHDSRISLAIYNSGASTVFLGPAGVTTANGFPLAPAASIALPTSVQVYGIVASGTVTVNFLDTF